MNQDERKQFMQHWEQVRRKGVFRYTLLLALTWGTLSAAVIRLIFVLMEQGFSLPALQGEFYSRDFLRFWGIFLLGGLCYSLTLWFYYQWLYRKYSKQ